MRSARLLALLPLLAACGPLVPEVSGAGAEALLAERPPPLVVDLRAGGDFDRPIPGAIPLSLDEVDGYLAHAGVPLDRPLLFACNRGRQSQTAGRVALERGYRRVYSLAGGMNAWNGPREEPGGPDRRPPAELRRPRRLEATRAEQLFTVMLGVGVKVTYMVLSALLIALLWRAREPGLLRVRQAMVAFLFGEGMCAANFLFAAGGSDPVEVLHGLGMLVMGALLPWGALRLLDDRVFRYQDPAATCAFQRLCGHCWKREEVPCGLHRLFLFVAPALAVASLLPLCAPLVPLRVEASIFGTPMLDQVTVGLQALEFRVYPLLACALLLASFALLLGGRRGFALAQPPFFAGLGLMTFSLMRFLLFRAFRDRILWADGWEEATEFMAIALVLFGLYVFRGPLGLFRFLSTPEPPRKADPSAGS